MYLYQAREWKISIHVQIYRCRKTKQIITPNVQFTSSFPHFYCIWKEAALLRVWLCVHLPKRHNYVVVGKNLWTSGTVHLQHLEIGSWKFNLWNSDLRIWLERSITLSFFQELLWEVINTCVCSTHNSVSTQLIAFGYFPVNRLLRSTFTILNTPTQEKIGVEKQRSNWHYWVNNKCNSHPACLSCYCFVVCFWLPFR